MTISRPAFDVEGHGSGKRESACFSGRSSQANEFGKSTLGLDPEFFLNPVDEGDVALQFGGAKNGEKWVSGLHHLNLSLMVRHWDGDCISGKSVCNFQMLV